MHKITQITMHIISPVIKNNQQTVLCAILTVSMILSYAAMIPQLQKPVTVIKSASSPLLQLCIG